MGENNTDIRIIRSGRKSIALEITKELNIIVRAPYSMSDANIHSFINEKEPWLRKHMELMKERIEASEQQKETPQKLTVEEIRNLADKALVKIPERASHFAPVVGVHYGKITIRNQVSRWGSCSCRGNLNFNMLLMLTPPDVIDYVVVHELCHLKELNHSEKFWSEVERVLPNYEESKKWLKDNGYRLIQKLK